MRKKIINREQKRIQLFHKIMIKRGGESKDKTSRLYSHLYLTHTKRINSYFKIKEKSRKKFPKRS